jgi:RHS repeat-associated protein
VYWFSSKPIHANSGLYYYGYRFYWPELQRWINRDPIGERGGPNLYAYVRNEPASTTDEYGLKWTPAPAPPTRPRNTVICRNNRPVPSIVWKPSWTIAEWPDKARKAYYCTQTCAYEHEESHIKDILEQNPKICVGVPDGTVIINPDNKERVESEINAHIVEYECLQRCKPKCPGRGLNQRMDDIYEALNAYGMEAM